MEQKSKRAKLNNKKRMTAVMQALETRYPEPERGLKSGEDPFRLLIMAILSAQTTDARVNLISPALFERFPDAKSIADSSEGELEEYIKTVGLYNTKAKNIRNACRRLVDAYEGVIPSKMEDLLTLGGVGRKVANLIRGDLYGLGGIVADTHCIRIANRLGFVSSTNPLKVEKALDPLVPKDKQSEFCHRIVLFGREVCSARNPKCSGCELFTSCDRNGV
ncbi:MAG: endonuclease III [Eubacteriales bacterium]|nr:endonuclease III [Eubacteriales bacterium]MDD4474509.1 endonuclease III [Eubacteriales bacterium]